MKNFWQFVHERQAIWHRREVGMPKPWTDDVTLRDNFFTNVFRELDPGTIVAKSIVDMIHRPRWERLWNLILYRRLNREDTWRAFDGYIGAQQMTHLEKFLRAAPQPLFTGAHQVHGLQGIVPGRDIIARQVYVMDGLRWNKDILLDPLSRRLQRAKTAREAFDAWVDAKIPGVGDFLSWQLALDCRGALANFSDDEWAPVQAGAAAGLKIVYPSMRTADEREWCLTYIRDQQGKEFRDHGLEFSKYAPNGCKRLTVAAVEHSLCEYSKYVRIARGGHAKGKFDGRA